METQATDATTRAPYRTMCTAHCSTKYGCGRHFRGMGAFERHLKRINESAKGETPTYDLEHLSDEQLEAAGLEAVEGYCAIDGSGDVKVKIWRIPLSEEVSSFFQQARAKQQGQK